MSDAMVQFVWGPSLLLALAGLGWFFRRLLNLILHQVQNDHDTNLRNDVDKIIIAVEKHDANDKTVVETLTKFGATLETLVKQGERHEKRLDEHLQHHAS